MRPATLDALLDYYRPRLTLQPEQWLAVVGAGRGETEIVLSMLAEQLTIYVQDVADALPASAEHANAIRDLYYVAGRSNTATFHLAPGTETDAQLPAERFDHLFLTHSLHEFTHTAEMLASLRRAMKPDRAGAPATVWVEEAMASYPGQTHPGCGRLLFTPETLRSLMHKNGFRERIGERVAEASDAASGDQLVAFQRM